MATSQSKFLEGKLNGNSKRKDLRGLSHKAKWHKAKVAINVKAKWDRAKASKVMEDNQNDRPK